MIVPRRLIVSVLDTTLRVTAILAVAISILSCSGNNSTSFLSMDRATESPSLKPVSGSHGLYELNTSEGRLFAASLKECQLELTASPASLTRQLFVGFDNLHILSQEKQEQGQILSEAEASIDGSPILLLAISTKQSDCIFDTVFWRPLRTAGDRFDPHTILTLQTVSKTVLPAVGEFK